MSRHFTLRKMLRMTPNRLLREFFQRLGHRLPLIDWRRAPERCDDALLIAIDLLPQDAQDEMEAALAAIHELACDSGVQAILEAAAQRGRSDFVAQLPEAGPYYKAMWTWLHFPTLFDHAALMHQVDDLTRWRKRKDLPRVEPRTSPEAISELACAISKFLRCEEGRGQNCTVEHYRRTSGTDYFVAYPDDFMQTIAMHDDAGNLQPRSIRQTFEIVFAYDGEEGTLELFAKMPARMKARLECLFGQVILGEDVGLQRYSRPYDLNRLKDRYFCLETDPEDGLTAAITAMRLVTEDWGKIGLEPHKNGHVRDVYDMADHCLNDQAIPWDEVDIQKATFRFRFDPMRGRRAGTVEFDVTHPDRCTVKSRRPERIDLVRKYLKRWRIADV
jgi:hypothetical protein